MKTSPSLEGEPKGDSVDEQVNVKAEREQFQNTDTMIRKLLMIIHAEINLI